MLPAPIPTNDADRLATLRGLEILDTDSEERFDRVTRLASSVLRVPIALVSLVDANRQWFKSCVGLGASETPRDVSFCGHAIQSDDLFYIPDAREDARFADNPLVTGEPFVIFYAGQPLKAVNGLNMGTLCVIDHEARTLTDHDKTILKDLARIAENELNILKLNEALKIQKESERQVRDVLDNVREGLFAVQPDLTIGPGHSPSLTGLLNEKKPAGKDFVKLIAKLGDVDEEALSTYLRLLIQRKILRGAAELNTISEFKTRDGRVLAFKFNTALRDGEVTHLVVTTNDISAETRLAAEIEAAEAKSRSMIEKLMDVMHLSPGELQDFMRSVRGELDLAVAALEKTADDVCSPGQLDAVRRHVHTAKGDAAVLGVQVFVRRAHDVEAAFAEEAAGAMTTEAARTQILSLFELVDEISATVEKAGQLGAAMPGTELEARLNPERLREQTQRMANETDKRLELDVAGFDPDVVPARLRLIVRNALVQFIRNSIAHGVESPVEREAAGKGEQGKLQVATAVGEGKLTITYQDDGRGIQIEKLREILATKGGRTPEEVTSMNAAEVARSIFQPGVSTADAVDTMAGRGVGMDVVRESVRSSGGTLKLHSRAGAFFRVQMIWPVSLTPGTA
ncbi:MAG: ATP-binding protein [Leptospirales bacterium]|jgi:HPt (histidine-containing phosphotransfer) domain-containing protein/PAS domain-containing protein